MVLIRKLNSFVTNLLPIHGEQQMVLIRKIEFLCNELIAHSSHGEQQMVLIRKLNSFVTNLLPIHRMENNRWY